MSPAPIVPRITETRDTAVTAAMDLASLERHLHDRASAASRLSDVQEAFYLACRDVFLAIENAPVNARPRGWSTTPESRTA